MKGSMYFAQKLADSNKKCCLLFGCALFAGIFLLTLTLCCLWQPKQAFAYDYIKTETSTTWNRCYVRAFENNGSIGVEFVGSDEHSMARWRPSYDYPDGWHGWVDYNHFLISSDQKNWFAAVSHEGSISYNGANFGHHGISHYYKPELDNGTGYGSYATYGFRYQSKNLISQLSGPDTLYYLHVHLKSIHSEVAADGKELCYGTMEFWPRITIIYDANGGSGASPNQYKYIGSEAWLSSKEPTREGYRFKGWSTVKNGEVNIKLGQKIGEQDWNIKRVGVPRNWKSILQYGHSYADDKLAGKPSPTGTNVVRLYAVWEPIAYNVSYQPNGATSGTMLPSVHTYGVAKELNTNQFKRSYLLYCNPCGGSAAQKTLTCEWPFAAWNTAPNGAGYSYNDQQKVKNLARTSVTVSMFALWHRGYVTLPSPGSMANADFDGWYTAQSGGTRLGGAGDVISIDRTTYLYAHWRKKLTVNYYMDASTTPVFTETVPGNQPYYTSSTAREKASRTNCSSFEGWFFDREGKYPFTEGSTTSSSTLSLYGYNKVLVSYALTDATEFLLADESCYLEKSLKTRATREGLLPASFTCRWGATISAKSNKSLWYVSHDVVREATYTQGLYLSRDDEIPPINSLVVTQNTTVYLGWKNAVYDGIEVS